MGFDASAGGLGGCPYAPGATGNVSTQAVVTALRNAGDLLGLLQDDPEEWFAGDVEGELTAGEIEALIEKRRAAKTERDFATADAIRNQLSDAGITIQDGPDGTTWRRKQS